MCCHTSLPEVLFAACVLLFPAPEGKRSSGLTAVWVARNRFAVLDRMHSVRATLIRVCSTVFCHLKVCAHGVGERETANQIVVGSSVLVGRCQEDLALKLGKKGSLI